ncbi:S-adenosyl-L-methionine-dependent methyltransferase [Amycolatopsis sp. NBRC 101858]|uniref:class I SAM-dependent methyltransferase n=1 Tax=Amycolatopsis sp. NBRC 101858 TaxID=3032200 RepID=UPI0024A26DC9|nr:SAM-dependent methyltransferase [Amycolatopsis sp. NBRC 101858]GLY34308.1 S-adenosyl-L-methionine-dependent methyltransferase [Amycolatopsis sp. NBRC 101858]
MESRASFTAETMALQRAFESHRPRGRRRFDDPYATAFLRPSLRVLAEAARLPGVRHLATGLYDAVAGPGPRASGIARTKVIDDALTEAMTGGTQCVLLGAGYDARAHRLPALAGRAVFEVDHPATQARKRAVLGEGPRYVPVDFERDDLPACLLESGFDQGKPSVFLWEGVTNYLTAGAVDATLAAVHGLGGDLVFTYVDVRALHEPSPFPEARRWVRAVARSGEPWTFGLLPAETRAFLAERGFDLRKDVSTHEAGGGSRLYRIAIAARSARAPHQ